MSNSCKILNSAFIVCETAISLSFFGLIKFKKNHKVQIQPTLYFKNMIEDNWYTHIYRVYKKKGEIQMGPQIQSFTPPLFYTVCIGRLGHGTVWWCHCPLAYLINAHWRKHMMCEALNLWTHLNITLFFRHPVYICIYIIFCVIKP